MQATDERYEMDLAQVLREIIVIEARLIAARQLKRTAEALRLLKSQKRRLDAYSLLPQTGGSFVDCPGRPGTVQREPHFATDCQICAAPPSTNSSIPLT
jgi:hypothetical protein